MGLRKLMQALGLLTIVGASNGAKPVEGAASEADQSPKIEAVEGDNIRLADSGDVVDELRGQAEGLKEIDNLRVQEGEQALAQAEVGSELGAELPSESTEAHEMVEGEKRRVA